MPPASYTLARRIGVGRLVVVRHTPLWVSPPGADREGLAATGVTNDEAGYRISGLLRERRSNASLRRTSPEQPQQRNE